ncbi:MAG: transferase [Hyphomonadaceae bacterium]
MFLTVDNERHAKMAVDSAAESEAGPRLIVKTRAESPELRRAAQAVEQAAWNDLGFLNYTRSHYDYYGELLDFFPDFQLCLVEEGSNYPVAVANSVPIRCDDPEKLPQEGWDWAVAHAAMHHGEGANTLCALAVSVPSINRKLGYARIMIRALNDLARAKGLNGPVVPVRPSSKAKHPQTSIEDYLAWSDDKGRPYDPWIRSHLACGARIVRPCKKSMVVEEPLAFWETWSNRRFAQSGAYELDGALAPVAIDLEKQVGRYEEPNVWVAYPA